MKRLLHRPEAAEYLGMSPRSFDAFAAPKLPYILVGRTSKRYDVRDLDKWADNQTKLMPADAAQRRQQACKNENQKDYGSRVKSGGSKKPSGEETNASRFMSQLDVALSRTPGGS